MSETSTSKQIFVTISTPGTSSHTFVTYGPDPYKLYLKRRAFWGSRRSLGSHPPILPKKGIFEPNYIAICTQQNSRLTYNLSSDAYNIDDFVDGPKFITIKPTWRMTAILENSQNNSVRINRIKTKFDRQL